MVTLNWPSDLPLRPDQNGFQGKPGAGIVVSKLETGPTFRRQRSTATPDRYNARILVTADQLETFDQFFRIETRGCLRFNWRDEFDVAAVCRFVGAPQYTNASGEMFWIAFEFEVLP